MKNQIQKSFLLLLTFALFQSCSGGDYEANYPSVAIGNQVWMKQNLDIAIYRNGDPVTRVKDPAEWAQMTTGAWCYYKNDTSNRAVYSKLYNWYAVNDPRGLAPKGWHIPNDDEWTTLSDYLGGDAIAGGKMKDLTFWKLPNRDATNSTDFSGFPGGFRDQEGAFFNNKKDGMWWSTSEVNSFECSYKQLNYNNGVLQNNQGNKKNGYSIRCIKDY
jgi:uncharacterized protein (TIGR02145 family)